MWLARSAVSLKPGRFPAGGLPATNVGHPIVADEQDFRRPAVELLLNRRKEPRVGLGKAELGGNENPLTGGKSAQGLDDSQQATIKV